MSDDPRKKEKIFHISWLCIAGMLLVAGLIWAADLSHIDDVVYNKVSDKSALSTGDMQDSDNPLDYKDGETLVIKPGKGLKMFTSEVDLKKGDAFRISFNATNTGEKEIKLYVDLFSEEYDDPCNEFSVIIPTGEMSVSHEIAFYRDEHPDTCMLRIFTTSREGLEIKDLEIDYMATARNDMISLQKAGRCMHALSAIAMAFLIIYIAYGFRSKAFRLNIDKNALDISKSLILYIASLLSVTAILLVLYRKANLSYPLVYTGGDDMGVFYYAKNIDQNGLSLANTFVGGLSGGDMFDYPYSDNLSFAIVWFIGLFTDNPYKIINLFYFLQYYIICIITTAVSRKLSLSRINSYVVGMLFAFSPYIQMRYEHMWLTPYYMLPVACMMAIHIIQGEIPREKDPKKRSYMLWGGIVLAFICAFTGLYYAYFSCALFAAAMVIRIIKINGRNFRKELYPIAYIVSTITGVIINVVPNIVYWICFGTNPYNELTRRSSADAERYGLKLVQMILPRNGHRIDFFRRITGGYNNQYPLVNENMTAALGIIATIGLMLSLFLLFSENKKYKEISYLNLAIFIIATIGGIGSIISVAVSTPMRCYNRMSLIIMFLSLLFIGLLLDQIKEYIKPVVAIIFSLCVLTVGLFDQTVDYAPYDYSLYNNTSLFLDAVEESMDAGDMIFMLPYDDWPTPTIPGSYGQFIGYIETDDLHWSYGAMQGREEALWQNNVASCELPKMIEKLKYAGYDGIYLDKDLFTIKYGDEAAEEEVKEITELTGVEPLVSKDTNKYFWKIDKDNNSNIKS